MKPQEQKCKVIADLYSAGNDAKTIVKLTKYCKATIYNFVKRLKAGKGIEFSPCGTQRANEKFCHCHQTWKNGLPTAQISTHVITSWGLSCKGTWTGNFTTALPLWSPLWGRIWPPSPWPRSKKACSSFMKHLNYMVKANSGHIE